MKTSSIHQKWVGKTKLINRNSDDKRIIFISYHHIHKWWNPTKRLAKAPKFRVDPLEIKEFDETTLKLNQHLSEFKKTREKNMKYSNQTISVHLIHIEL